MNRNDITAVLIEELGRIAPETDPSRLDPKVELREELDIDSMDFLNLVTALSERLAVDIPETDYPNLATFGHAVDYLVQRLGGISKAVSSSEQP
jgi:acyl carrier protein